MKYRKSIRFSNDDLDVINFCKGKNFSKTVKKALHLYNELSTICKSDELGVILKYIYSGSLGGDNENMKNDINSASMINGELFCSSSDDVIDIDMVDDLLKSL